jgi:acetylornithine deacetylase
MPSLDMSNRGVIDILATWLEDLKFRVEVVPLTNNPNKANLIATRGEGSGGLVLSGHTDTVPYDQARWSSDPFTLTERDGRWYGLGATDMKAFFGVALTAIQACASRSLSRPLTLLATADEESSMDGARQLLTERRLQAEFAVIGEPTNLQPMRLHKGIMMESLRFIGRSGHSSNPAHGINALEAMTDALTTLRAFREELAQRYQHPGFEVTVPTLNFGSIRGGDNPNRICGECELHFDLRALPGMSNDELRAAIRERLEPIAQRHGAEMQFRSLFAGVPSFEERADATIVTAVESICGHTAGAVGFATEAPFLQALGMQTVIFGPGSITRAHQPDEYLEMAQIEPATVALGKLIHRFCG